MEESYLNLKMSFYLTMPYCYNVYLLYKIRVGKKRKEKKMVSFSSPGRGNPLYLFFKRLPSFNTQGMEELKFVCSYFGSGVFLLPHWCISDNLVCPDNYRFLFLRNSKIVCSVVLPGYKPNATCY